MELAGVRLFCKHKTMPIAQNH
uniref:Uncharacterized protein n=1 Tax=Anguilla anguilla TaxID=7936 RepID=A0A0E9V4Y9_ANGAN